MSPSLSSTIIPPRSFPLPPFLLFPPPTPHTSQTEMLYKCNPKMLNQFQYCEREGVPLIVIVGEEERVRGGVKIRDVEKRQEVHCCAPTQANDVTGPHKALCGLFNSGQLITITIVTSCSSLTRDRNHITCKFVLRCESFYGYLSALHLHTPSPRT